MMKSRVSGVWNREIEVLQQKPNRGYLHVWAANVNERMDGDRILLQRDFGRSSLRITGATAALALKAFRSVVIQSFPYTGRTSSTGTSKPANIVIGNTARPYSATLDWSTMPDASATDNHSLPRRKPWERVISSRPATLERHGNQT